MFLQLRPRTRDTACLINYWNLQSRALYWLRSVCPPVFSIMDDWRIELTSDWRKLNSDDQFCGRTYRKNILQRRWGPGQTCSHFPPPFYVPVCHAVTHLQHRRPQQRQANSTASPWLISPARTLDTAACTAVSSQRGGQTHSSKLIIRHHAQSTVRHGTSGGGHFSMILPFTAMTTEIG